ncbi:ACT domain-containing protein [Selenomonas sp. F0473]|uniref:ACT domain-containing protein n=1 Tax=Selenomonas sp. F0473 TaxID=999423 RepID=UPI00029DE245|nr:ACT domain-containing protein [Selenomonas sp. F0473]EKU71695.1 hypothetical protein HMPREF9161_00380 [Selenomonas sp. F0473]
MGIDMNGVYLVREEILPKSIRKTILAKEMIHRGEVLTVNEAVAKANLSRSAYYKYKDYVFPFFEATRDKIITLSLSIRRQSGVLRDVLGVIAAAEGNVMTVNQGLPMQGTARVDIAVETIYLKGDLQALMDGINRVAGVERLEVIAQS